MVKLKRPMMSDRNLKEDKNEHYIYYNSLGRRFCEGKEPLPEFEDWNASSTKDALEKFWKGMEITSSNDKGVTFTVNGKKGSLRVNGYMLILNMDDGKGESQYPLKNINNLSMADIFESLSNLLSKRGIKVTNEAKTYIPLEDFVANPEDLHPETLGRENNPNMDMEISPTDDTLEMPVLDNEESDNEYVKEYIMSRFLEMVRDSLLVCDTHPEAEPEEKEVDYDTCWDCVDDVKEDNSCDCVEFLIYLSPSYSMSKMSNIVIPIRVGKCDKMFADGTFALQVPSINFPDASMVFNDDYPENAHELYDKAIQDYIDNDISFYALTPMEPDNLQEAKAALVDYINSMAESYMEKKNLLDDSLSVKESKLLNEGRYFIVPEDTDIESDGSIERITPLGFTDLNAAKNSLLSLSDSGKFPYGLKIMDTNLTNDRTKWTLL